MIFGCESLSEPFNLIRAFHNAFRRDVAQIDDSILNIARSSGDLPASLDRLHIMGEILDYHARAEELAVFPAVDHVAPLVATAYILDHRELDTMVNGLEAVQKTFDPYTTARATAVLKSHLMIHLRKEDVHLYPILKEQTTESERASIVSQMAKPVPPEKYPMVVQWLFPLLDLENQVAMTKVWMTLMPPQVFDNLKLLIKKAIPENWGKLTQQIPELDK